MQRIVLILLYVFTAAIPLDQWVVPGIGTASRVAGIPLLLFGALAVFTRGRIRRFPKMFVGLACFVVWGGVSILWSADADSSAARWGTYIQLLAMSAVIIQFAFDYEAILKLLSSFVVGCAIAAAATIGSLATDTTAFLYESRFSAYGSDPNELGLTLGLGLVIAFYLGAVVKRRGMWLWLLYLPVGFMAVLLTASRGSVVATVLGLGVALTTLKRLSLRLQVVIGVLAFACVSLAITYVPAGSWERVLSFEEKIKAGDLNSRQNIWVAGWNAWGKNPIVGVGVAGFPLAVEREVGAQEVAHNTLLSVLVENGLVGLVFFLSAFGLVCRKLRRTTRAERRIAFALLLTLGVGTFALSWEYKKPVWFFVSLLACDFRRRDSAMVKPHSASSAEPEAGFVPRGQPA